MQTFVEARYSRIEKGSVEDTPFLTARLLELDVPAFVIADSGVTLAEAIARTGIADLLRQNGYEGDVRDTVDFGSNAARVLPPSLTGISHPVGDEWAENGVTPLHSDLSAGERGQQFSINLTLRGRSEVRLHENLIPEELLDEQWDILDSQVSSLLWNNLADPEIISPEGFIAELSPEDLLVFDPSYAHMVRGKTNPRYSEATFFEKQN